VTRKRATFGVFAASLVALTVAGLATGSPTEATEQATPGSAGTDVSLPLTDSAVTVSGRGRFSSMRFTVNQTAKLNTQAISVTWTGGTPTDSGQRRFNAHFVQMFQCWGDDDGTNADNPGPPPEQCVQGAVGANPKSPQAGLYPNNYGITRVLAYGLWAEYETYRDAGYTEPRSNFLWKPFRAVDGTSVNVQINPRYNPAIPSTGTFWLNPYYNEITTNEIAASRTYEDGTGRALMQVNTGVDSTGLGCGQKSQPVPGGAKKIPKCWLVIVPRGGAAEENAGTPFVEDASYNGVSTSPLFPPVWQNRIAIPLEFIPVDSPCDINKGARRMVGGELALAAIASWQPALCSTSGLPPYSYAPVSDDTARGQISNAVDGAAGMVVVSAPLEAGTYDSAKPVVYAPLTLSGLVIGFNIERWPKTGGPAEETLLQGLPVQRINLTPRLVAKLLTQSYTNAVSIFGVTPSYSWLENNAPHLGADPDFLQFNPEFTLLQNSQYRNFAGLTMPAGASDAAKLLWKYVLADTEARNWLSGAPDPWGMVVNPVYSTNAATNPLGVAFGDPLPNSFPKSDPYCYQPPDIGLNTPTPLCGTDWLPYSSGYGYAAQVTRSAADGARVDPSGPTALDLWKRDAPQVAGFRSMLSVTDTASAERFGLQVAALSRAGDSGADRSFIVPTDDSLTKGVEAMTAGSEPTVLEVKPDAVAPGAYPLTILSYAAISPLSLTKAERSDYAAFVRYAAGAGQVSGLDPGQLPVGYVPLPDTLKAQAVTAAGTITSMKGTSSGGGGGYVPPTPETTDTQPADTTPAPTTAVPTTTAAMDTSIPAAAVVDRPLTPKAGSVGLGRAAVLLLLVLLLASGAVLLEMTVHPIRQLTLRVRNSVRHVTP